MSKDTLFIDNGNNNVLENVLDNGREYKVLELLKQEPSITGKAMAEKMGLSTRQIGRIIKKLREDEIIIRVGSDRKGYWKIKE